MSRLRAGSSAFALVVMIFAPARGAQAQAAQDTALVRQEIERIRGERRPYTGATARGDLDTERPRGVGLRAEAMIAYTGGFDLAAGERTSGGYGPMVGFALTAPLGARISFALSTRLSQTDFGLRELTVTEPTNGGATPPPSPTRLQREVSTFAAELSAGLEQELGASGTNFRLAAVGMRLNARQQLATDGRGPAWLAGGELGLGIPIAPWARASVTGQHLRRTGGNPALPIDGSVTRVLMGIQFGW